MVPEPIPEIQMSPQPKRRMPRVRFYDVENIGHALRIMLHRNQIPFNEIDSYFNNFDTNVSIAQLKQIFRWYIIIQPLAILLGLLINLNL
jgi:hypothetical protein